MSAIIFHIDVNSAFLSWSAIQALENGSTTDLREIPSIIGGDRQRRHGVVLAKSLPAKNYKIVTGEPIVNALRKCPNLVIVPPDHHLYAHKSQLLMEFLLKISPDIEQASIDECYMDFGPIAHLYESPEIAAGLIKKQVREQFGFTVNIGISDRKVLAKMASDFKKPDLVHTLFSHEIKEKMWPMPVSSLYMCGKSSVEALRNLGIMTIGDLAVADREIISSHLKSHGLLLWEYANGIDPSVVITEPPEVKGIGNSTTLSKDLTTKEEIYKILLILAESVSGRLRASAQCAGMVSTEIKYNTFQSVSHQRTLLSPADTTEAIYKTACSLFDELWDQTPIRLLGIRTAKLTPNTAPVQMNLFDLTPADTSSAFSEKQKKLDHTLDDIRKKFGDNAIKRGSLFSNEDRLHKH